MAFPERDILYPYEASDIIKLKAKSINIFGYKASKNVIITYSSIILIFYTLNYIGLRFLSNGYIRGLFSNAFLLLCFVLVTLRLLEWLGPKALLVLINISIKIRYWCIRKSPLYDYRSIKKTLIKNSDETIT